ncbi:hypothetical protein C8J57DRAFT_1471872 [Mycena rebaudengoi]|nr:hypothetical protein C8J57DRAFT_1471872 [Mycena rebaudengoi]
MRIKVFAVVSRDMVDEVQEPKKKSFNVGQSTCLTIAQIVAQVVSRDSRVYSSSRFNEVEREEPQQTPLGCAEILDLFESRRDLKTVEGPIDANLSTAMASEDKRTRRDDGSAVTWWCGRQSQFETPTPISGYLGIPAHMDFSLGEGFPFKSKLKEVEIFLPPDLATGG